METSVIVVANSIESKEVESKKNENKNNRSSENKNDEAVSAAVVESGDGNNTADAASSAESSSQKKNQKKNKKDSNRILVSHTKKPFVFYLSLAKRYIKQYNDIELSGLGMAIPTVVTIAEALKREGLASHQEVKITTVNSKEVHRGHFIPKAKIQIVLGKGEKLDKATVATATPTRSDVEKARRST